MGLNAGSGNIGVPVIQLIGLAIIAAAGTSAPRILLGIDIPLIVIAAVCAAAWMDNLTSVRNYLRHAPADAPRPAYAGA